MLDVSKMISPQDKEAELKPVTDRKIIISYDDGKIIFKGYIKKLDYNKEEFYDYFHYSEVPMGWYHRKEYDFFYYPNLQTLMSILKYKLRNPDAKFAVSFCSWVTERLKDYNFQQECFNKVRDLTLKDIKKIKALPDLMPKVIPDFLHQKLACYYAFNMDNCGLFEEQGCGKTKTAIETFLYKKEKDIVDRCLVLAPLSVLGDAQGTLGWSKHIKEYTKLTYIYIRGTLPEKRAILNGEMGDYDFYLTNYEAIAEHNRGSDNLYHDILEWVDDRTMIIADESSKIKNAAAKRTKALIAVGAKTKHKLILTGTPITQGARDIYPQFRFLDGGDTFGTSQERFDQDYFFRSGYNYIPKRNALDIIHNKVFQKAFRVTKEEALDLPEKVYQVRTVDMTPLQQQYYNTILNQEIIKLENSEERVRAQIIIVMILRLQQITSGFISTSDIDGNKIGEKGIAGVNPKIQELDNILDELDGLPIVIWSRFRFDVDQISKLLDRRGITYVTYIGGMPQKVREDNERKFMDGSVQVFVSIPSAGGMGMNLQRASYEIYYSNDYSLQNRLQSEDRVHRIGQVNKVTVIDIICNSSIDKMVHSILKDKKNVADVVTGDINRIRSMFLGG